jgi:uncharacterized protein (TIGR02598 family)
MSRFPRRGGGRAGFSLIETVMALSVVAVVLIPMVGLMPIGLTTYRNALDQTAGASIAQQIFGEYDNATSQAASQQRYFDNLGQETTGASSASTVYYVNVVETTGYALPGDSSSARQLNHVQVEVWYNPGHLPFSISSNGLISKTAGEQVREYSSYVAQ